MVVIKLTLLYSCVESDVITILTCRIICNIMDFKNDNFQKMLDSL